MVQLTNFAKQIFDLMRGFLIIVGIFWMVWGVAQPYANFIVRSADSIPFLLELDGVAQLDTAHYDIKVVEINDQSHQVKLLLVENGNQVVEKALYFEEMGVESTMELVNLNGAFKLRYFGEVSMGAAPIVADQVITTYKRDKSKNKSAPVNTDNMSKVEMYSYELQNNSEISVNNVLYANDTANQEEEIITPLLNDSIVRDSLSALLDSNKVYAPEVLDVVYNYSGEKGCSFPDFEANQLIEEITRSTFSSQKVKLAKAGVKDKCLTTHQVEQIANALEYEDDKLTFIKYAYAYVYDRKNYKNLTRLFMISNTRNQFLEFIRI